MSGLPIRTLLFSVGSYEIVLQKVHKCDLSIFYIYTLKATDRNYVNKSRSRTEKSYHGLLTNRNWMNDGQISLIKSPDYMRQTGVECLSGLDRMPLNDIK